MMKIMFKNKQTCFKKSAFNIIELIVSMTIIGTISICCITALNPRNIKTDAIKKAGLNEFLQIDLTTKKILLNNSTEYNMVSLKNTSGTAFSLTDENKNQYISELYAKYMSKRIAQTASDSYKALDLKNEAGTVISNYKVSTFSSGIMTRNGSYMAFKLNEDCNQTETDVIYNPSLPDKHTQTKSCGLIFYDVTGEEGPNVVGIDMYIVSIGKLGLK